MLMIGRLDIRICLPRQIFSLKFFNLKWHKSAFDSACIDEAELLLPGTDGFAVGNEKHVHTKNCTIWTFLPTERTQI
jgi:hypothetical protein